MRVDWNNLTSENYNEFEPFDVLRYQPKHKTIIQNLIVIFCAIACSIETIG